MRWIFANRVAARVAQALCKARLPQDKLADGSIAPVQYTKRWARLETLPDGRVAFIAGLITKPAAATQVADNDPLITDPAVVVDDGDVA